MPRANSKKKWIQGAIKRPGALTRKAKAAGKSVHEFAEEHKRAPGLTGQQSRLALTLERLRQNPATREQLDAWEAGYNWWSTGDTEADANKAAGDYAGAVRPFGESDLKVWFMRGWSQAKLERSRRKNPAPEAAGMYEKFHGEPSDEVVEIEKEEFYHGNLATCGVLCGLKVRTINGEDITIGFDSASSARNPFFKTWIKVKSFAKAEQAERKAAELDNQGITAKVERKDITKGFSLLKKYRYDVLVDRDAWIKSLRGGRKGAVKKTAKTHAHKGYKIVEDFGEFTVPQLDTSRFESLKEAKRFIDAQKKGNRGPVGESLKFLSSGASALTSRGPAGAAYRAGKRIGSAVDDAAGRALRGNPGYGPVLLTTNEKGNQLYIEGGDQSLDISKLKITEKDSVVIGEAWAVCYRTRKSFDDFQDIDYVHGFGEERAHPRLRKKQDLWEDAHPPERLFGTGQLPTLRYDCLNESMHLDGGVYQIKKPWFGVSPGIEN
jgi:hypothetical protein